jgi:stress-induced morphogen
VNVVSPDFEGKTLLKANRMVIDVLRSEIKDMHAVRIVTRVPQHKD